jgi:hypothetical protein
MKAPTVWADVIGEVSATFMNATVSLLDPSLVTSVFDVDTNSFVSTGNPVVAEGISARVQPVRLAVDTRAGSSGNPGAETRLRVQIPRDAYSGRIQRGWQVRVTSATRNPELLNFLLIVDAVVNSSWRASITVEATVSVENSYTPSAVTSISGVVSDGVDPVANATVRAFYLEDNIWLFALAVSTDANGSYVLSGTDPAKTYVVVASRTGFVTEYFNGATDFVGATPVAHNATGINFALAAL